MVQIYEQVISDIENKVTHCNFLHWLQNSELLTSAVVEYSYFDRQDVQNLYGAIFETVN